MRPSAVKSDNAAGAAREEKRMARQRRILILRRRNAARAVAASSKMAGKRVTSVSGSDTQNNEQDLYSFCTPDNKVSAFVCHLVSEILYCFSVFSFLFLIYLCLTETEIVVQKGAQEQ